MRSKSYHEYLINSLKNSDDAVGYLKAALEENGADGFLIALRNVIEARVGMPQLAKKIKKSHSGAHKMLSKNGNPTIRNTILILDKIGIKLSIESKKAA